MCNAVVYVLISFCDGDFDVKQFDSLEDSKRTLRDIYYQTLSQFTEPSVADSAIDELDATGASAVVWYPPWRPDDGRNQPTLTAELFSDHGKAHVRHTGCAFAWQIYPISIKRS